MSDAQGAQAISALSRGAVRELPSARTFAVTSSDGATVYVVTLAVVDGALSTACTCPAGAHGQRCWHARAAALKARQHRAPRPRRTDLLPDDEPSVGDLEPDAL